MSLQYVVYDYWEYGYAVGDAILEFGSASVTAEATVSADGLRIRTSGASITGNATVTAQAATMLTGSASVSANALLSAQGTRIQSGTGSVNANATVSAQGIRIKTASGAISGFASVSAYPSAVWSGRGSIQASAVFSATGQIIGEEWVNVVPETNVWFDRKLFDPYVEIDYWEDGYADDRYDYWVKTPTINNTWMRQ